MATSAYYPPVEPGTAADRAICALPVGAQWAVMERINAQNGCHFFTASRPDRDPARYRVDFSGRAFLDYAPSLRFRCKIMSQPSTDAALVHLDGPAREDYCRNLFQSLWQLDLVTLGR